MPADVGQNNLGLKQEMQPMFEYNLEHLLSFTVKIAEPEVIGPVPEGLRVNGYITGGEVTGPRISGKLRPVGGDWLTIRKDGVAILDVRATIETHDEALIGLSYWGILDMGDNGYEAFLQDDLPRAGRRSACLPACPRPTLVIFGSTACTASGSGRHSSSEPKSPTTFTRCAKAGGLPLDWRKYRSFFWGP